MKILCEVLHSYFISNCILYSFQWNWSKAVGSTFCQTEMWKGIGWGCACSGIFYFVCHINLILSLCFNYLDRIQGLINSHSSFNLLCRVELKRSVFRHMVVLSSAFEPKSYSRKVNLPGSMQSLVKTSL